MSFPQADRNVWCFAYGSNLLRSQMEARTGPIRTGEAAPRVARLPGYRLAFNMNGGDGQIYANVMQHGEGVLGVVYRCGAEVLEKLDWYEQGYVRQQAVVIDTADKELDAILYVAKPESLCTEGQPSAAYLDKILTGAREQGLDEGYVRGIEALAGKWGERRGSSDGRGRPAVGGSGGVGKPRHSEVSPLPKASSHPTTTSHGPSLCISRRS